ncbi:ATG8-interacting protein 1-like [Musa acuminata AAA Group]|uniref:ATG8-interacting protein 1-like n=1 Tax=Musa acuminata AAA Group TaxID=214697 RepID=UPI0031E07366
MADNEKKEEGTSSRGVDWEVVSLTASAYAASPGPEFDPTDESREIGVTERESSAALFMSGHFVFPPSEHENLPIEPDVSEIHIEPERHNVSSAVVDVGNDGVDNSDKEKMQIVLDDDLHAVKFFDEGSRIAVRDMGFEDSNRSQRQNLVGMEQDIYADPDVAIRSEECEGGRKFDGEEAFDVHMDSPRDHTEPDEDEFDGSNLPCQSWWKRHAVSLYRQAKEADTFWSVVVAAAVVGIIVLGHRWQRNKWQLHQIKWRFSINDGSMMKMLRPIGRYKDVLVGAASGAR